MGQLGPGSLKAIHKPILKRITDLFANEEKLWRNRLHQTITRPNSSSDGAVTAGNKNAKWRDAVPQGQRKGGSATLMRRRGMSERNARYAWRAKIVSFCLAMFVAAGLITPGTAAVSNPEDAVRSFYSVFLGNMQQSRALGGSGRYAR